MLIRRGFVTNSSSTSFIFYGFVIRSQDMEDKIGFQVDMGDVAEKLHIKGSPISSYYRHENNDIILYVGDSYISLYECGIQELPTYELCEKLVTQQQQQWDKLITKFCEEHNLPLAEQPEWRITIYIER